MAPPVPAPLSVLIVQPRLPEPDRDSGSLRLHTLIELLVADGHELTFLAYAGGDESYAEGLGALGVEVIFRDPALLRAHGHQVAGPGVDFDALFRRRRFDLVWLSFFLSAETYLPAIRRSSPATRVVIDTVDVQFLRERRGALLSGDPGELASAERTRAREIAVYSQADGLVAVSADDAAALEAEVPDVPVHIVGNVHAAAPTGPGFADRSGLVFVGSFLHAPNVDAILDFHATAWPEIRRARPGATLTIVGQSPPPEVEALAGDGIEVTGWVPSTVPYLDRARVSIAPLRFGAGVKGKIGEALNHGLPVVTTPIGAEGMGLVHEQTAMVCEPGLDFARAVVRAHEDAALWERLAQGGRAHIAGTFSPDIAQGALRDLVAATVAPRFVLEAAGDADVLAAALSGFGTAFAADDPASLMIGVAPGEIDETLRRAEGALADAGLDPDALADVAITPHDGPPPVPSAAVRVGALPPAPGELRLAPTASAAEWRAAARGELAPAASPETLVSIVISAYGQREVTERCLASIEAAVGPRLGQDIELVLVDNGSLDDTAELFEAWQDRATVLFIADNRNFAGGSNAGARIARGRVLLFLNNDTEVMPGAIERLAEEALGPQVGAVGARLLYPDGTIQHAGFAWRPAPHGLIPFHLFQYERGDHDVARSSFDLSAVTGACVAVPREAFEAVGGFDEGYVQGWEDVDLCLKLRAAGTRIRYCGDAVVVHHEGITTGRNYGNGRNEQRFFGRWAATLAADEHTIARALGGAWNEIADRDAPADVPHGADVRVIGPLLGFGSDAAEARGILAALGHRAAALTPAPTAVMPALSPSATSALRDAHQTGAAPNATTIQVIDEASRLAVEDGSPVLLRVSTGAVAAVDGAIALAPAPTIASALVDGGWPADRVVSLPPVGVPAAAGPGGHGILALLAADHAAGQVEALRAADLRLPVRVVPLTRTQELESFVREAVPGAELLGPVADESRLAELARQSDIVLACDPADRFDRRALVAAGAGAAVVVRPGGPAAELLESHAHVAAPDDVAALAAALRSAGAVAGADARAERSAVVARASEGAAARLAHLAGVAAAQSGAVGDARRHMERAVAAALDPELLNDLGAVLYGDGELDKARVVLEMCLLIAPDHAVAGENLEIVKHDLGVSDAVAA